jgi:hypothetical protein
MLIKIRRMSRCLSFIFVCLAYHAFGQKEIHLDLGAGLTSHVIKDDAMSPVRYTGVLPTVSLGTIKTKANKKLSEVRLTLQYSNIHAKAAKEYPTMKGPLFRLDFDYVHLRQTKLIKDTIFGTFFVGGSFHTLLSFRFMPQLDNSAIVYDYFSSLGISAAYQHEFNWLKKRLRHYHRLSVPVISVGSRPAYMNVFDFIAPNENDPVGDAFDRASVRSFGSHVRVIFRNSLFYPIRSNNLIGFTYEWQYYGASFTVPIKSAYHSFVFSLLVHL